MFSSERRRHFGLPGDIFRKLYPRPPRCEFSGQSRMIPQILRFRSSRELQLCERTDGRIRLRLWIFLSPWNGWLRKRESWAARISMRLNRKWKRKNSVSIGTRETCSILIYGLVESKLVFKVAFVASYLSFRSISVALDGNQKAHFLFTIRIFLPAILSQKTKK